MPSPSRLPVPLGTALALLAFAGNSLLCRAALRHQAIDAATFTAVRLAAGAVALLLLLRWRDRHARASNRVTPAWKAGSWLSAAALAVYAVAFSWAYQGLATGTGALLLFGSVQTAMLAVAHVRGDRLRGWQWPGLLAALAGLGVLVSPGVAAPPPAASAAMVVAGVAWALYTLRGRGASDALAVTAGHFARAALPVAGAWWLATVAVAWQGAPLGGLWWPRVSGSGLAWALASGALTSGLGYAVWYAVLPCLPVTLAASLQLAVPLIAALLGVLLLGEAPGWRLGAGALLITGGLGLVIRPPAAPR